MTLLRVLLISSAIIVSVKSFPSTTGDYEKKSTAELETKETTDPVPVYKEDPQTKLDTQTNLEGGSSTVEFVLKSSKEGLSVQKGSTLDKYTISNSAPKNENEKLNLMESSKENEIDTDGKAELYKLNITDISKNEDLISEAQIKRDQWLFDPHEISAITGGLSKYFYDAATPIHPFPELSETVKSLVVNSDKESMTFQVPVAEKSYKPPETAGPMLYPQSEYTKEIDVPFYFH